MHEDYTVKHAYNEVPGTESFTWLKDKFVVSDKFTSSKCHKE